MRKERIETAIEIIDFAIKNNVSIKEACKKCGFGGTYVKNVKGILIEKYQDGLIEDDDFNSFMEKYEQYIKQKNVSIPNESTSSKESQERHKEQVKFNDNNKETTAEWKASGGKNYPLHIKTVDELLKATEVDINIWRIKNCLVNKWDVTSWKSGHPETEQNFQVKAWLERKEEQFKFKVAAELFREMVEGYKPPQLSILPKIQTNFNESHEYLKNENNLFEVNIYDLHIGKLSWWRESGENYDVKIASERFMQSIETLLYRASSHSFKEILFPIGNDFFNSDTLENTTTKGTRQDEDLRWKKTFRVGCKLIIDGINLLKQTGVPVRVIVIPGNHDFQRSYYMGEYLSAWFNNDTSVIIDNSPSPRKYFNFGKVLLGFTHGNEEKESSLPMLMANERGSKEHWSNTIYREWHLAHNHRLKTTKYTVLDKHKELEEEHGVTVRYLSSLAGTDEWHHKKGYTIQLKGANGFIWNDEMGMIAELKTNIRINTK